VSSRHQIDKMKAVQVAYHDDLEVPDFPRIDKVVLVMKGLTPGKMLDIGYSKGSFADYMVGLGWDCTGLDVNKHNNSKVKTIQCDLNEDFPVEDGAYDVVTAGEVIEHMLDEDGFLAECNRVLKPEGVLALTTPNLSYLLNRFLVPLGKLPMFVHAPYHYHFHTKKTIIGLIENHGFKIEKIASSHLLYSRRLHATGRLFEWLGDLFPTLGAHLIVFARKI
jgi:2-polyprenyl-3-methyl-5-hydroxy-6-metoxy-1,4-benzoquinol methylase